MTGPFELADRPALRPVQVDHTTQDGKAGVALTDPLGLAPGPIFVPEGLLPILSRFDGTRTPAEIEADIVAAHPQELPPNLVRDFATQLDELLFLDGPRFHAALGEASEAFAARTARPAIHAGVTAGYPGTETEARAALDSIVYPPTEPLRPSPQALIAPHIDIARGREGYSLAYSALAECEPADLYVVFGTGHQGPQAPVTGLRLNWETPLGEVRTDRAFVDAVHERIGPTHPGDVLLHATEHSLEFQMLFLRHVLGVTPFQVAGFLTGPLPLSQGAGPDHEPVVQSLVEAFRDAAATWRAQGRRVCFVAGADLAHIGPMFGDTDPVDEDRLADLAAAEQSRLKFLERGKPSAFHAAVESDGNPDRICGGTPIYLAATLAGTPGRLLHYGQANAADGSQTVSFCSMLFETPAD